MGAFYNNAPNTRPVGAAEGCESDVSDKTSSQPSAAPTSCIALQLSGQTRTLIDRPFRIQLGRHIGATDQMHALPGRH